jgi:hypothetical protein
VNISIEAKHPFTNTVHDQFVIFMGGSRYVNPRK